MTTQTNITSLLLLIFTVVTLGCDNHSRTPATDDADHGPRVEALPFHDQIYRSFDGMNALTIISSTELELRNGETTLLCKYSKQTGAIRVVITSMGASQVVYFRFTDKGLQANNGRVLLSPQNFAAAMEQARKEKKLDERVLQIQNEYAQAKDLVLSSFAIAQNSLVRDQSKKEIDVISRYSDISIEIKSAFETQLNELKENFAVKTKTAASTLAILGKEEVDQAERELQAAKKPSEKVANAYPATPELHRKAYEAKERINALSLQYLRDRDAIELKYSSKLVQEKDLLENAYRVEEARLKNERDEKIRQNNQAKDRELKPAQLKFAERLDALISKRDADLSDLEKSAEHTIEDWTQKIMK